jgi:hypothetical protein
MPHFFLFFLLASLPYYFVQAQEDDLLSALGEPEEITEYAIAGFKTTRVINSHSFETTAKGVLNFKISHRFGFVDQGLYDIFGLDNATIKLAFEYGLTPWLDIGVGRSTVEKMYDGYVKCKLLRQSKGKRVMPFTVVYIGTTAINTLKWQQPDRTNYFTSRLSFAHQLIIGRKFTDGFSLQLMPTLVHRNLVASKDEKNDVIAIGIAARQKISKRLALNAEYYYVLPNQIADNYFNSLSVGLDIETGGHVFQLHFTNSTSMAEKGFIAENTGDWLEGQVHFGFNVSRVFTLGGHSKK